MNPFEPQKRAFYQGNFFYEPFINKEGRKISRFARCDIMIPGDYDFGLAEETVTITVESGMLISRGVHYMKHGIRLIFQPNQMVGFNCEENARVSVNYG
ncbi:MAG: hypothetical protein WCL23_04105 [Candidatus Moraniibacteriota bacterium]